jgi:hypothetical protein
MKIFKHIDWLISAAMITWYAWYWDSLGLDSIIEGFFIVGGWHIISMLSHNIWMPPPKKGMRHYYHWISFICVITLPMGSYWIVGALAPFMAIFYTCLCIIESFSITFRPHR